MSETQHYFSRRPATPSQPTTVHIRLPDLSLELESDRGVFAHGLLDRGTELLLRTIPAPPAGRLLDLGCGYGAVAIALALRNPAAHVWAVDVNERALQLTRRNATRNGADNVTVCAPEDVAEDMRFAALYSNPPVRVGKDALRTLLSGWLRRLDDAAPAFLVVQRNLGADSLAAWLQTQGHQVQRVRSRSGYRVLEVHAPPGRPHD